MSYIKKVVIHGFKSFPRKTELPLTPGINVILGPNGSGKSNVTDALCFVLGRLSIKSMRAAKASNLIFLGTKGASPAKEASVEITFDNSDKSFAVLEKEVLIKRIVRRNGMSIYKINGKTQTRQEILSLLATAGIDPNGFNIVLQGEIQNFVRMQGEERRKVIEEVAGISIYESRKEKSIKELEKTEDRLKEISSILKERKSYLANLEKEREAALKHKKFEEDVRRYKKSILYIDLTHKKKEEEEIVQKIEKCNNGIEKVKKEIMTFRMGIESLEEQISEINSTIQEQTGLEQEQLNHEIANLRAELAGLTVKRENNEKKIKDIARQKNTFETSIQENKNAIKTLQKESPTIEKIQKELGKKKNELEILEEERKKYYMLKSELKTIKERVHEKKTFLQNYSNESTYILKQIDSLTNGLYDKRTTSEKLEGLWQSVVEKKEKIIKISLREKALEKIINVNASKIEEQQKVIEKIGKLDICPLCKNKITDEHIHSISDETFPKIQSMEREIDNGETELTEINRKKETLTRDIDTINFEIQKRQSDILKLKSIHDKNEQLSNLQNKIDIGKKEFGALEKRENFLENNFDETSDIEERYENLKMDVEDISLRNKENLTQEISFKQRTVERAEITIKQFIRESIELNEELKTFSKNIKEKDKILVDKRKKEEVLIGKAKELIAEREELQGRIKSGEIELSKKQNTVYNIEQTINNYKIHKARIDAEIENFETEILEFTTAEIVRGKKDVLIERLRRTEESLSRIGTVNMRALEVYEEIKNEYESIEEKVEIITKEKEGIMKIIHEIDIKKKKAFLNTLNELNVIFTRNFSQISTKGHVSLEIQNKKQPFEAGIDVIVKTGHGKYFDVKSLSGGEQTMVALSLIFAIQELRPYCFYILDEIDAALDKRNSERLGALLKKYMQKGQYIIITHNDEIITGATNLFGISMHEGISKVISLHV